MITELEIGHRVSELAAQIAQDYRGVDLHLVGILKGAFVFLADLMRRLHDQNIGLSLDFVRAFSYGVGERSSGEVRLSLDAESDLTGRQVLVVDDIVDSGRTLALVCKHLMSRGAASVRTCVLLDKPSRREVDLKVDYVGFIIPDKFVVGYGMDFAERSRHLPFIMAREEGG
jgi:hypoxanthine phosphoribosyltransferase